MFAVGHITLGYIIGKILSKATEQNLNIPALWTVSLLPDIDFIFPGLQHRGPTHSILVALLILAPFFIIGSRKTIPYFTALATHSIIGDLITDGGVQLFWPLSSEWMEFKIVIKMGSTLETYIELGLFMMLIITLIFSKDIKKLFNPDRKNIILFIPLCTIVLPALFRYPIKIPRTLIIPHFILLTIIAVSFLMSFITAVAETNRV